MVIDGTSLRQAGPLIVATDGTLADAAASVAGKREKGSDEFIVFLTEQGFDLKGLGRSGKKFFVMIDEIQYLANPLSIRIQLADHPHYLEIIVPSSSGFTMDSLFKDSLAGRTVKLEIDPLSFRTIQGRLRRIFVPGSSPYDRSHQSLVRSPRSPMATIFCFTYKPR